MTATLANTTVQLNKEITEIFKRSASNKELLDRQGEITFSDFLSDKMLMILLIREGVPYSFFSKIQEHTPFSEERWADFLDLSTKSLQRYKQADKTFRPIQSEKIIEIAEVTKVGLEVFDDMDRFKLWLETPNYALGSLKPIELLRDSYGKELVISELTRINCGVFV